MPTIISRQVLQDFVVQVFDGTLSREHIKELGNVALNKLRARQSAFEEQITLVSEKMADMLQVRIPDPSKETNTPCAGGG